MPGMRLSPKQRAKAVRLVVKAMPAHGSQWAAIEPVVAKIGASAMLNDLRPEWTDRGDRHHGLWSTAPPPLGRGAP